MQLVILKFFLLYFHTCLILGGNVFRSFQPMPSVKFVLNSILCQVFGLVSYEGVYVVVIIGNHES
jgi:hypothetical protein